MAERTDVPDLRVFINAIVQAEQTGIPVGPVLRTQANQLRVRRRQRAELAAERAPVKMVLVLATMVLPAMLLFIAGPAAFRVVDTF
jgi:tight adherence protein C